MGNEAGNTQSGSAFSVPLALGEFLVKLARSKVHLRFGMFYDCGEFNHELLSKPAGAFVTIETYPGHDLRGCIGYPLPYKPLRAAVEENAINAAFEDPRFNPLSKQELGKTVFEVTVLSPPEAISYRTPEELEAQVKIGEHGLIVYYSGYSGLLLPQVPVEYSWSAKEFLSHTCIKAGLASSAWRTSRLEWQKFSGTVFQEQKPMGKVVRKQLIR